jgi:tetratricopeptide (TPR) repeat protein
MNFFHAQRILVTLLLGVLAAGQLPAQKPVCNLLTGLKPVGANCESYYEETRRRWQKEPKNAEAGWQFGRACFELADRAAGDSERSLMANDGIAACRRAIELQPQCGPARYFLAMNLGQLARTMMIGSLKLIREMEAEWKEVTTLDPTLDYAGAHRALAELYCKAPGWPLSIGNRNKAKEHYHKAIEVCPEYPDNLIYFLEASIRWSDRKTLDEWIPKAEQKLKDSRAKLNGKDWESRWKDWDERWERVKARKPPVPKRAGRGR